MKILALNIFQKKQIFFICIFFAQTTKQSTLNKYRRFSLNFVFF